MKIIPRLLLVSFLLLAMVSPQEALAGSCKSTACNTTYVAPSVQPAPTTASASTLDFTAIGGSGVADVNLSPEDAMAQRRGQRGDPCKRCSTAADRAKLVAEQSRLRWPSEIPRPSSRAQSHYSIATRVLRNSRGRVLRSVAGPVKPVTAVKVAIAANAKSEN